MNYITPLTHENIVLACFRSDYLSALSCETVRKDKSAPSSEPQETATSRVDLFSGVDRRFDGTDREKEEAYYILKEKYAAVRGHASPDLGIRYADDFCCNIPSHC